MACLFGHKWNGCKCAKCGHTRDEGHDWDLCKGVCRKCGAAHPVQHDWDGSKCRRCGKMRSTQDPLSHSGREARTSKGSTPGEPACQYIITAPDEEVGNIIANITGLQGSILSISSCAEGSQITVEVPLGEKLDNTSCPSAIEVQSITPLTPDQQQKQDEFMQQKYARTLMTMIPGGFVDTSNIILRRMVEERKELARKLTDEKLQAAVYEYISDKVLIHYENEIYDIIKENLCKASAEHAIRIIAAYPAYYGDGRNCSRTVESTEWRMLSDITDVPTLKSIATTAKNRVIRYRACKLAGGHFFDSTATNQCECTECGFEFHIGKTGSDKLERCEKCGGILRTHASPMGTPYTTIDYGDGTEPMLRGDYGLLPGEHEYVEKFGLS